MTVSNQSWIESANHPTADFTLANLPLGVIEGAGDDPPCIAVPIGDRVLNLGRLAAAKVLDGVTAQDACALHADSLNDFAALGRDASRRLRSALQSLLAAGNDEGRNAVEASGAMSALADAVNCMPFRVGDYTDFYASKHHASNVGSMFRPDGDPLLRNWKHLPVGYHGRASSIVAPTARPSRPMASPPRTVRVACLTTNSRSASSSARVRRWAIRSPLNRPLITSVVWCW